MTLQERVLRLPQWAQVYIGNLITANKRLEQELNAKAPEKSHIIVEQSSVRPKYLPDYSRISFLFSKSTYMHFATVHFNENQPDTVDVRCSGAVSIRPFSTNVFHLTVER